MEFTKKKASSEKIMVAERRAMRELEEKESVDAGNAAWKAYAPEKIGGRGGHNGKIGYRCGNEDGRDEPEARIRRPISSTAAKMAGSIYAWLL
jgi:hypothetical protein